MCFIKKIKNFLLIIFFVAINGIKCLRLKKIRAKIMGDFYFCGCRRSLLISVIALYEEINGITMGLRQRLVLWLWGNRLCVVTVNKKNRQVVGVGFFYFNKRDFGENTIHEGFIGFLPDYRGRGLGTAQRLYSIEHFAKHLFLEGVSSRISLNNIASLKSNISLGYRPQEKYFDSAMGEDRFYLVCDLNVYR